MRIIVKEGDLWVEVPSDIAAKVLRIQHYVGGLLSEATMDAIVRDLGPLPYTPQEMPA